ncbi:hypothetical protein ABDF71_27215 [Ochrobactrum sp. WV_118_8]|uniref:hypothetical protein n=1 Tax=Brucella anthropi TaxID=529 RepID=UPI00188A3F38|nr:hypothetical protein [Brucella anthropi]QPA29874.1 hypothetical protein IR196_22810 [Brucella anthropi]
MSDETYDRSAIEMLKGLNPLSHRKPWHGRMVDPTDPVQVARFLKSVEDYALENPVEDLTALITQLKNELAAMGDKRHGAQDD